MKRTNVYQSVPNRTGAELRAEFERRGLSIAEWARAHGFSSGLVYQVLTGRKRCLRGQSHQIAVLLGLKQGEIGSITDIGADRDGAEASTAAEAQSQAVDPSTGSCKGAVS
jgi:gp16 family phage-associated protein